LVFAHRSDVDVTWSAHPFLRETFRQLLGCPVERVFDVVARSLGAGLDKRPRVRTRDPTMLDRYERLIEATRLAGREEEAYALFDTALGAWSGLSSLGEYQRGYRILSSFGTTEQPEVSLKHSLTSKEPRCRTVSPSSRNQSAV
jgi:hypothetical protein